MAKAQIAQLTSDDFPGWLPLWDKNNQGLRNETVTAETWARLNNPDHPVNGMKATINGEIAGIMHYILHPVTGHIEPACYMQDLFVDPSHRRKGIAKALVRELEQLGKKHKWARIYWLAEGKNEEAQALYKHIGLKLDFTFHLMPLHQ